MCVCVCVCVFLKEGSGDRRYECPSQFAYQFAAVLSARYRTGVQPLCIGLARRLAFCLVVSGGCECIQVRSGRVKSGK